MLVLLRTNQVATMLAVSANTVRNWADQNILPVHSRTAGGHRQFALRDVRTLWIEQTAARGVVRG
jgi:DNA-binding transcriptional MerR regulator